MSLGFGRYRRLRWIMLVILGFALELCGVALLLFTGLARTIWVGASVFVLALLVGAGGLILLYRAGECPRRGLGR